MVKSVKYNKVKVHDTIPIPMVTRSTAKIIKKSEADLKMVFKACWVSLPKVENQILPKNVVESNVASASSSVTLSVASSETNNEKLQEAVKEDGAEVSSIAVSTIDFASASASGDVVEYQTEPNEFDPIESTEDGNMVENPNVTLALTLEGSNNLFSTPKNVPFAIRGRRRSTNDKPSRSIALQRVREILKSFTPSQNVAPNAAAQQVTKRPLPDLIPINKNEFLRRHSVYVENFEGDEDDSSDEEEKEDFLSFIQRKKKELKPLISRK